MNTIKLNSSYLESEARKLRSDVRKSSRKQGFEPMFDKDFVVGVNANGELFVCVNYQVNGGYQCSNCAV